MRKAPDFRGFFLFDVGSVCRLVCQFLLYRIGRYNRVLDSVLVKVQTQKLSRHMPVEGRRWMVLPREDSHVAGLSDRHYVFVAANAAASRLYLTARLYSKISGFR